MKAKLTEGQIEYFQQPDWLLGDATIYAVEQGFKNVLIKTGTGGTYETETAIVIETPEPEQLQRVILTPLDFLGRFAQVELRSIFTAAKTNIDIEIWKIKFDKASGIDLTDPQTIQGVAMLEQFGLITPARKEEILKLV